MPFVGRAANDSGIEFAIYTRRDVARCFTTVGAGTCYEIAESIARHVPALAPRLPKKRRSWTTEDRRMALFNAAALVFTHFRYQSIPRSLAGKALDQPSRRRTWRGGGAIHRLEGVGAAPGFR